jgi:hypothetical protein
VTEEFAPVVVVNPVRLVGLRVIVGVEPPPPEDELRGAAIAAKKSLALSLESVSPPFLRKIAVFGTGARPVPSQVEAVVPYPTKSIMAKEVGAPPERAVVDVVKASLPEVADKF